MARANTKQQMIATAAELFRRNGYHGTSWRMLVESAGTPWGSAHYYFPGGKAELAVAAVAHDTEEIGAFIEDCFASNAEPGDAIKAWFAAAAKTLRKSDYHSGCRVATVALETAPDSVTITRAIRAAFKHWEQILAEHLLTAGLPRAAAEELAILAIINLEGALILARVRQRPDPIKLAGEHIASLVRAANQTTPVLG